MCERELETEQNCNILTPTLLAITAFLSRSPGQLNRGLRAQPLWDMFLNPASSLQLVWSPTDWISWALSYMVSSIVQWPPSSCGRHNFALIQPVHGQIYNIMIFLDRMHLLFTQVHFLFWQPGWVVGQYTTPLQRGKTPPNECPVYDTKQSDGEVPAMLGLWGIRSTSSLPLLPGPLWPGVVAPDRALSMGTNRTDGILMLNWNRTYI